VLADNPESMSGYLGPAAVAALSRAVEDRFIEVVGRDRLAVQQYRAHAIDSYGEGTTIPSPASLAAPRPTVSVILATMRPHMVPNALRYMQDQTYPNYEVVVSLHGWPRDESRERGWREMVSVPLQVRHVERREALGMVYNRGIEAAAGDLVTIWDDDDHYGPNHLWDLVIASRVSRADLVGKGAEFNYLEGPDTTIQRFPSGRYRYSSLIGGPSLTLGRRLVDEMGGFAPLSLGVDRDVIERVQSAGGKVYRDHGFGYLGHRRPSGHTWDPGYGYFLETAVRQWPGLDVVAAGVAGEWG